MSYDTKIDIEDLPVEVEYVFIPACRGKVVDGLRQEPDEPASVDIHSIKTKPDGIELINLLPKTVLDEVTHEVLDQELWH